MPAPATTDEFLDLVRKSGVLGEDRLSSHLTTLSAAGAVPATTNELAARFIRDGLLTQFQARQLLLGKWRRFHIGSKYKLLELLGAGGMGAVYLCEHIFMRRLVALKVLPGDKMTDELVARFQREAQVTASLDHPNIVRSFDMDHFDGLHVLVMEYIDGASLHEIVAKAGPLDPVRAAHYVAQTAYGLQYAHESGLVHRDIKPGNLLVDRTGTVKILDLGLARFFDDRNANITEKYSENTVLGTADYLSPEQAVQSKVDIRADIYSLGATFYFLLAGRAPFQDGTVAQKLVWHQVRQPEPVTAHRNDVPPGLAAVLHRMLAKKPDERYQHPAELVEALAPWTATPIPPPDPRELPRLSPAVAAYGRQSGSGEFAAVGAGRPSSAVPRTAAVRAVTPPPSRTPQPGRPAPVDVGRDTPTPRHLADDGPPETMALPRPGSEEEKSLLQSVGRWKSGGEASPEAAAAAKRRVRTMLVAGGSVAAAVALVLVLAGAYVYSSLSAANRPIDREKLRQQVAAKGAAPAAPPAATPAPPAADEEAIDPDTPISPEAAARYVGQECTVEFEVMSTGSTQSLVFLNSKKGGPSSKSNFTLVLTSEYLAKAGKTIDEVREACKTIDAQPKDLARVKVRVKGEVSLYKGKPQIKSDDPGRVTFTELKQAE